MKIGIGVTTHNRTKIFEKTYEQITRFLPANARFVVIDDASDIPCAQATHRFATNVGIATAKNKCLELLDDCDHIFLFDDDCYPIVQGWEKPYIESPEPHLMYLFQDFATGRKLNDAIEVYKDNTHIAYSHPRGCMLYIDRKVIDVVGGYDTGYKRWGFEHVDFSNRIYNNRLTSFRYADVIDSNCLVFSADEHEQAPSTVNREERQLYLDEMNMKFNASFTSKKYCDYKESSKAPFTKKTSVIIAAYFTKHLDVQRNKKWIPIYDDIKELVDSCAGQNLVILHDELEPPKVKGVEFVKVHTGTNPYFQRWLSSYQYLRDHPEIESAFLVDSTDVTLLHDPFPHMKTNTLYIGDEPLSPYGVPISLNHPWLMKNTNDIKLVTLFKKGAKNALLNCGVVGGSREIVIELCHKIMEHKFTGWSRIGELEMPIFNYLCYTEFADRISHGRHVTTVFKQYEESSTAWFKHK